MAMVEYLLCALLGLLDCVVSSQLIGLETVSLSLLKRPNRLTFTYCQ
jgi:hypothetical protein